MVKKIAYKKFEDGDMGERKPLLNLCQSLEICIFPQAASVCIGRKAAFQMSNVRNC